MKIFDMGKNLKDVEFNIAAIKDPKYLKFKKYLDEEFIKKLNNQLYNYAYDKIVTPKGSVIEWGVEAEPDVLTKTAMQNAIDITTHKDNPILLNIKNTTDKFVDSYPTTTKEAVSILRLLQNIKFDKTQVLGQPFINEIKKSLSIIFGVTIYGKTIDEWINNPPTYTKPSKAWSFGVYNSKSGFITNNIYSINMKYSGFKTKDGSPINVGDIIFTQDNQPFGVAVSLVDENGLCKIQYTGGNYIWGDNWANNSSDDNTVEIPTETSGPYKLEVNPPQFHWKPLMTTTLLNGLEAYERLRTDYEECRIPYTKFYISNDVVEYNLFEYWKGIIGAWQSRYKDEITLEWVFIRQKYTNPPIQGNLSNICEQPESELLHELLGDNDICIYEGSH